MIRCDSLVGIPFLRGGRDGIGMDCLGVVLAGLRLHGVDAPDIWSPEVWTQWQAGGMDESWIPVGWQGLGPDAEPQPLDVLIYRRGGIEQHIGLYLGSGWVLHAREGAGTSVTRRHHMRMALAAVVRPPGVEVAP
jgi:cell wall-associated NlpC family hydrolase